MNSINLKQVKGNFQRLFDKNLTDLVRGLRNNKDNEVGLVSCVGVYRDFFSQSHFSDSKQSTSSKKSVSH